MAQPPKGRREDSAVAETDLAAWMVDYGPGLRRFFSRRAGPNDADDLVQEVFLRLQARADGDPVENVEGYLFKVARNVLVSRYREQQVRGYGLQDLWDETAADLPDDLSPERILIAKQEYERLIVAVLALPPRARTAFQFHRFENMTYQAIAKRMGISKVSVKELMQRAIDRLSEEMEHRHGS
jgi:RNA polymerase sigma factor (sigma-70 family)